MDSNQMIDFIYSNRILQLGTVVLKSGEYSDHFYNFGRVDSTRALCQLSGWLVDLVEGVDFNCVFTSPYKGIVLQTGFALEYQKRFPEKEIKFGYQRKDFKFHGETGDIVGYNPKPNDRVLLIDDAITTGFSIIEMVTFVKNNGATPILVIVPMLRAEDKDFLKLKLKINVPVKYLLHDRDVVKSYGVRAYS